MGQDPGTMKGAEELPIHPVQLFAQSALLHMAEHRDRRKIFTYTCIASRKGWILTKVKIVRKCFPLKGISFDSSLNMRTKIQRCFWAEYRKRAELMCQSDWSVFSLEIALAKFNYVTNQISFCSIEIKLSPDAIVNESDYMVNQAVWYFR